MTVLHLTPVEEPAVRRALVGVAESLEMDARSRERRRGFDRHVAELREEAAVLRAVDERLAGDQSPVPSRALVRAYLRGLDDERLRQVIETAEELLDARFLESSRVGRREVDARYCTPGRR